MNSAKIKLIRSLFMGIRSCEKKGENDGLIEVKKWSIALLIWFASRQLWWLGYWRCQTTPRKACRWMRAGKTMAVCQGYSSRCFHPTWLQTSSSCRPLWVLLLCVWPHFKPITEYTTVVLVATFKCQPISHFILDIDNAKESSLLEKGYIGTEDGIAALGWTSTFWSVIKESSKKGMDEQALLCQRRPT